MPKLNFPTWTYTKTDQFGAVETITTRQVTIDGIIWSDRDIDYYEGMNKLIEADDKKQLESSINELTESKETIGIQ